MTKDQIQVRIINLKNSVAYTRWLIQKQQEAIKETEKEITKLEKQTACKCQKQKVLNVAQNQCIDCDFVIGEEPKTQAEWNQALRDEVEGLCWGDRV